MVPEKQADDHAGDVAATHVGMRVFQYPAQEFPSGASLTEPVMDPFPGDCPFRIVTDKVIDCFSEDAVMDVRVRGELKEDDTNFELKFNGREEIENFYNVMVHEKDRFSASHLILNPVVDVKGDSATGIFYLLEPTCIARAMWGHGRYDMKFVRVNSKWKISRFGFLWNFNSPYSEGWDKLRMAVI